jgi:hypothetical protein
LLVADGVYPGHFRGKFHMAPSERKVRRVEYSLPTDATNAGELAAARWPRQVTIRYRGDTNHRIVVALLVLEVEAMTEADAIQFIG